MDKTIRIYVACSFVAATYLELIAPLRKRNQLPVDPSHVEIAAFFERAPVYSCLLLMVLGIIILVYNRLRPRELELGPRSISAPEGLFSSKIVVVPFESIRDVRMSPYQNSIHIEHAKGQLVIPSRALPDYAVFKDLFNRLRDEAPVTMVKEPRVPDQVKELRVPYQFDIMGYRYIIYGLIGLALFGEYMEANRSELDIGPRNFLWDHGITILALLFAAPFFMLRRFNLRHPRELVLGPSSLSAPKGVFSTQIVEIPYSAIVEVGLKLNGRLVVSTKNKNTYLNIHPMGLPDPDSYREVESRLQKIAQENGKGR